MIKLTSSHTSVHATGRKGTTPPVYRQNNRPPVRPMTVIQGASSIKSPTDRIKAIALQLRQLSNGEVKLTRVSGTPVRADEAIEYLAESFLTQVGGASQNAHWQKHDNFKNSNFTKQELQALLEAARSEENLDKFINKNQDPSNYDFSIFRSDKYLRILAQLLMNLSS